MNEDLSKKHIEPLSSPHPKKGGPKQKTALILGLITCLFLSSMGYEFAASRSTVPLLPQPENKKLSILTPDNQHPSLVGHDKRQLALLNTENKNLSKKLLHLREETYAASQRLHNLQKTVFTAQNHLAESTITDLKERISEKEASHANLQNTIVKLEDNVRLYAERVLNMEVTIDTLSDMFDMQKVSKDQLVSSSRSEIVFIRNQSEQEKNRLTKVIANLENVQNELREKIASSSLEVDQIESDLAEHRLSIYDKELELKKLTQNHDSAENILNAHLSDITSLVHVNTLIEANLHQDLKDLKIELAAKDNGLLKRDQQVVNANLAITDLESDLSYHIAALMSLQQTYDATLFDLNDAKTIRDSTKTDLTAKLEAETKKNEALALNLQEKSEGLLLKEALADKLITEAERLTALITERDQELDQVQKALAETIAHSDLDQHKTELLEKQVVDLAERLNDNEFELINMHQQVLVQESLTIQLGAKDAQIAALSTNHHQLSTTLDDHQNELATQKAEIQEKESQLNDHKKALDDTLAYAERTENKAGELEHQLKSKEDDAIQLNAKIDLLTAIISARESELGQHKAALNDTLAHVEQGETKVSELEIHNAELHAKINQLAGLVGEREVELAQHKIALGDTLEHAERGANKASELEIHNAEFSAKINQLAAIVSEREAELAQHKTALNDTLAHAERGENKASELEIHSAELSAKINQLAAIVSEREAELAQHKTTLNDTLATAERGENKAHELEQQLKAKDETAAELSAKINQLTAIVSERETELAQHKTALDDTLNTAERGENKASELENQLKKMAELQREKEEELNHMKARIADFTQFNANMLNHSKEREEAFKAALEENELKKKQVSSQEQHLSELDLVIAQKETEIAQIKAQLRQKQQVIDRVQEAQTQLHQEISDLRKDYQSPEKIEE